MVTRSRLAKTGSGRKNVSRLKKVDEIEEFATGVVWQWEDVKRFHSDWSKKDCIEWLEDNEESLKDAMISAGNDYIQSS